MSKRRPLSTYCIGLAACCVVIAAACTAEPPAAATNVGASDAAIDSAVTDAAADTADATASAADVAAVADLALPVTADTAQPPPGCQIDGDCEDAKAAHCNPATHACQACVVSAHCPNGNNCDGGACMPVVCKPGEGSCDGNVATQCNALGTQVGKVECKGKTLCKAGSCVAVVCTPGEIGCQGGQTATCGADGKTWQKKPCPNGGYCFGGQCQMPKCALPTAWSASVHRISQLSVAAKAQGCDVDGDGQPDNQLAQLSNLLSTASGQDIDDLVKQGSLVVLLDPQPWSAEGKPFVLGLLDGAAAGGSEAPCIAKGEPGCKVLASATAYDLGTDTTGTCAPLAVIAPAKVTNGKLEAGGKSAKASIPIGYFGGTQLALPLHAVHLEASVGGTTTWSGATNGKLCGAALHADLPGLIDSIPDAAFAGLPVDKAQAKVLLLSLAQADLDLDGDGTKESVSAAFLFQAVPAQVTGLKK